MGLTHVTYLSNVNGLMLQCHSDHSALKSTLSMKYITLELKWIIYSKVEMQMCPWARMFSSCNPAFTSNWSSVRFIVQPLPETAVTSRVSERVSANGGDSVCVWRLPFAAQSVWDEPTLRVVRAVSTSVPVIEEQSPSYAHAQSSSSGVWPIWPLPPPAGPEALTPIPPVTMCSVF